MAGIFGSHSEDRARERELNRYLAKQAEAEARAAESRIKADTESRRDEVLAFFNWGGGPPSEAAAGR